MMIFDCFMFFDEEMMLDLRLSYLNNYVDKFIIVESTYTHSGKKRNLLFNIEKFKKYKDKIHYIVVDKEPDGLSTIYDNDSEDKKNQKYILNAVKRENYQRDSITRGLKNIDGEDYIMISDIDEIPNLEKNNIKEINKNLIFFTPTGSMSYSLWCKYDFNFFSISAGVFI